MLLLTFIKKNMSCSVFFYFSTTRRDSKYASSCIKAETTLTLVCSEGSLLFFPDISPAYYYLYADLSSHTIFTISQRLTKYLFVKIWNHKIYSTLEFTDSKPINSTILTRVNNLIIDIRILRPIYTIFSSIFIKFLTFY